MSAKKQAATTKKLDNTVKDVSSRLADLEKKLEDVIVDFGTMTRRHDMATETFDARTRQLLAWANEITEAAKGDKPDGMDTAAGNTEASVEENKDLAEQGRAAAGEVKKDEKGLGSLTQLAKDEADGKVDKTPPGFTIVKTAA